MNYHDSLAKKLLPTDDWNFILIFALHLKITKTLNSLICSD